MLLEIQFHYPIFLLVGIILCVIFWFFLLRSDRKQNFAFLSDVQKVYGHSSGVYYIFLFFIFFTTFLFFVFFAQPYSSFKKQVVKKEGIDIEIVFDLSYSMIAEDIQPNRLEAAKKVLEDFFGKLESDRVGLILFSGMPFTSIPLTFDYTFLKEYIANIQVDMIDQSRMDMAGTAIGDSLLLASANLSKEKTDDTKEQIIILITDGEANKGIDPLLSLKYLKEQNIKTYTIGVGKDDVTTITIPSPINGFSQKVQVGGIDEETLQKIALETGWKYYRADSEDALETIFSDIEKLEKSQLEYETYSYETSYEKIILALLTLCLFSTLVVYWKKNIRF